MERPYPAKGGGAGAEVRPVHRPSGRPVVFRWDGAAMVPRHPKIADREYAGGETYALVPHEDRSTATHNHEFAWLNTAWENLPETLADLFPTAEHLRKRALIDAGYYDETVVDAGSNAAALRVASAFRSREAFSLVIVRGPAVVIRTAKSQSRRAMKAREFQQSKTAIMEVIEVMVESERKTARAPLLAAARAPPK
jgi:hypothetical protein